MKKFVIIALIFALAAGAAFAQSGEWSVSGKGEIGTILNFAGPKQAKSEIQLDEDSYGSSSEVLLKDNAKLKALIGANGYHNIEWYGFIGAELGVRYSIGGLSAGIDFLPKREGLTEGYASYSTDTFAFEYRQALFDGGNKDLFGGHFAPERLWGYYKFLDGMIHLEAAVKSRDAAFWYSTGVLTKYDFGVVANVFGHTHASSNQTIFAKESEGGYFDLHFGRGFSDPDKHNYLLVNVAPISGLEFGVMVPGVFNYGLASGGGQGGATQTSTDTSKQGYKNAQGAHNIEFLDGALLRSRLGVKYGSGPIEFAAQFALFGRQQKRANEAQPVRPISGDNGSYKEVTLNKVVDVKKEETVNAVDFDEPVKSIATGLYLGGKFAINDTIGVGIGFQGEFWSKKPILGFGAEVGFASGPFSAGLGGGLYTEIDPTEDVYWKQKRSDATSTTVGVANKPFNGLYTNVADTEDVGNAVIKKNTQSYIGLQPVVNYALVENYLMLSLDSNLYWRLGPNNGTYERKWQKEVFGYEITPVLWFNVAGTGAAKGWYSGNNTAIILRYKVGGWVDGSEIRAMNKVLQGPADVNSSVYTRPVYNAVDISFKWSF